MQNLPSMKNCKREELVAEEDLGRLVSFLRSNLTMHIDTRLLPMDLTSAQYIVVVLIAKGVVDTLAGLCEHMVYDKGAMSRLLKRLQEKQLIAKQHCEFDKRSSTLVLTEKGRELVPEVVSVVNQVYAKALVGFSPTEKELLVDLLFKAISNLNQTKIND